MAATVRAVRISAETAANNHQRLPAEARGAVAPQDTLSTLEAPLSALTTCRAPASDSPPLEGASEAAAPRPTEPGVTATAPSTAPSSSTLRWLGLFSPNMVRSQKTSLGAVSITVYYALLSRIYSC